MDICVNLPAEANGDPAIVGTAKLTDAGVTNRSALRRTLHRHVISNTSASELVATGSVKADDNFSLLTYLYPFQCGEEREITSTLDSLRPSGFFAWDTQVMIPQSIVPNSGKELSPPADVDGEFS